MGVQQTLVEKKKTLTENEKKTQYWNFMSKWSTASNLNINKRINELIDMIISSDDEFELEMMKVESSCLFKDYQWTNVIGLSECCLLCLSLGHC